MPKIARLFVVAVLAISLLAGAVSVQAQTYLDLEDKVQEFTLDNGLRFLVLEDHDVPVFTFVTYVNVGSANEVRGITGISHILEHMAFKGTSEIGTTDLKKELKAMEAEDEAFAALKAERNKGLDADPEKLAELEQVFEDAKDAAREFVATNEFGEIVEINGGVGMNAGTGSDATSYFYSLPSNRLELWAYLEGTRMSDPVLREFYTEKDGPVTEERRMRTDNNPIGRAIEQFLNLAFMANGYHHSTIGYMSDIQNITRQDCYDYYHAKYVGKNFTIALVGDIEFDEVKKLAKKYFSGISGADPEPVETTEPKQLGEKRIVLKDPSQPVLAVGYHVEDINHPDDPVYDAIADILGQGRTSRLYTALVKEQKLAIQAFSFAGFPGKKYQNLMMFFTIPAKDISVADVEAAVYEQIDRLVNEGVTEEELAGVKQRAKANFIRSLRGNRGMAQNLAYYQAMTGDWRDLFRQVEAVQAITIEDIQRVAAEIFTQQNRTVGIIETEDDS